MDTKRRSAREKKHHLKWLLALFVIAIILALLVPGASAEWYQREITIDNSGGSALTDYQVLVTLSVPGDYDYMNSDGSDIRFTSLDNSQKYDYWIEDWDTSGTSKIWVEVPSIDADASPKMYLWSNSPGASSESNGAATFSFFDDFDNLDGWSDVQFYGTTDESTSSIVNNHLHIVVGQTNNRVGACTDSGVLSKGQRVEAKVDGRTNQGDINTVMFHSFDNLYENDPCVGSTSNDYAVWRLYSGSAQNLYNDANEDDVPTYPYTEYRSNDYLHFGTREQPNRANIISNWVDYNYRWGIYSYHAGTIEIDWVFVRKYASSEPETSVGTPSSTGQQPVPELSTLMLFSVGLIVLAGYIVLRRKNK